MRTLHYQFAGKNACSNNRFELAVRRYELNNQDYLETLPVQDQLKTEDENRISEGILVAGGYSDEDSVWNEIDDIIWNIREG